jgi:hypothetical protein
VGEHVITTSYLPEVRSSSRRLVLSPDGDSLKVVSERAIEPDSAAWDLVHAEHSWWITRSEPEAGKSLVRVYVIPTLEIVGEWELNSSGYGWALVPSSDLLVIARREGPALELRDVRTGQLVVRRALKPFTIAESWFPVTDESGYYVGAHTKFGVQLFAISDR